MAWNYKREEKSFVVLPEGDYRVKVENAEKKVSKSGNDMIELSLQVSGTNRKLFHYIVFMEDRPEITNQMLTQFFDSFGGIKEGELDSKKWKGKIGAVHVKHEEYNGEKRAKIAYFINSSKQGNLPAWKEAESETYTVQNNADDDDLPFD